jgi:hypothetical protein
LLQIYPAGQQSRTAERVLKYLARDDSTGTTGHSAAMDEKADRLPHRVEVTARFLAEAQARQQAYEARRRMWTAAFHPSDPRAQAAARSRRTGRIHDPRQGKLEL